MFILFLFVLLFSVIALIFGMIKPKLVIRWGADEKKTRKNVLKYCSLIFVISLIMFCITIPKSETTTSTIQSTTSSEGKDTEKEEDTNNDSKEEDNVAESKSSESKEVNALGFIGKSIDDIKKELGEPNKIQEADGGKILIYDKYSFSTEKEIVKSFSTTDTDVEVNNIKIGMIPKEIRSMIGDAVKEENNAGFSMEYRINDNKISIMYLCDDFRSPVKRINVTDLMIGKETPMKVTKDEVQSLIEGEWIDEEYINQKKISDLTIKFSKGKRDDGVMKTSYEIKDSNIITFKVYNSIETSYHDDNYFIEFYENGDRMEIFKVDKNGDRIPDTQIIYYRYK